jgi:hypothetical protein
MAASTFPTKPPPPFALTCNSLPCMTQEYAMNIAICRIQGNEACLFSTRFLGITEWCFEGVRGGWWSQKKEYLPISTPSPLQPTSSRLLCRANRNKS